MCVQYYYQHPPAVLSGTVNMMLLTIHYSPHWNNWSLNV